MPRVSTHLAWIAVMMTAAIVPSDAAQAQFITRWVNANGVITFSTSSPPPGVEYEAVPMPPRGSKGVGKVVPATEAEDAKATGEKKDGQPAKAGGAAQLKVQDQATTSLGETQWLLAGKVMNDGGAAADGVGIRISVFEDGQGNPCLEDHGTVSPSTIQPGETGTFELTYDSPCFFGSPRIDIVAEWQK